MPYVKLVRDDGAYNHIDSDTIEMCILGDFLGSDVRCNGAGFRDWFYNDAYDVSNSNATSFWKEDGYIVLVDMFSEEEDPTELKMTRNQFIKLLDEWLDVVCVKKPAEVLITEINGEFILETK
jgi:hypothetical protein